MQEATFCLNVINFLVAMLPSTHCTVQCSGYTAEKSTVLRLFCILKGKPALTDFHRSVIFYAEEKHNPTVKPRDPGGGGGGM